MMGEISRIHAALQPSDTLFLVDSMMGQDAVNVARAFDAALALTGVILTKGGWRRAWRRGLVGASGHRTPHPVHGHG